MKKIFVAAACFFITAAANSQVMQAKKQSVVIVSANLKCWECKNKLEKYLITENKSSYESGIIDWKINLVRGEIKLTYFPDRITADDIKVIMNNAGFDADAEKAEPEAYKKLPTACKRAEDGGGPKKGSPPCHLEPNN
jgi:mercuric ion binding protein